MTGFEDLIVEEDGVQYVLLTTNPDRYAPLSVVEQQIEVGGTTPFWQEKIAEWRQEGRIP